jgi:hypothetical protein
MKKWEIITDIVHAEGWQSYVVEAETREEALKKWREEGADIADEDINIQDSEFLSIEEIKEGS